MSNFDLPDEILQLFVQFEKSGFKLYLVGGAVRDLLLKKPINEWDFTTNAQPEEILKIFPEGFYNNKFGTVGVPSGNSIVEVTTMRKEGDYRDHRHPTVIGWTNKIEEDLARRDFSINAIAMDSKANIIDPNNGQQDIKNKIIRTVGTPDNRFKEDALRLIRAIRFSAQLNFKIDDTTLTAIKENAILIKEIANERIRDELFKILISNNAYESIVNLRTTGLLEIILPELEKCFGLQQEGPKHDRKYDIGLHSLLTLKNTPSKNPITRLSALLHDVGKPKTVSVTADGNVTFYNHEIAGAKIVLEIAKKFNLSKVQTDKLYRLVRWHMFSLNENQTDSAVRRFIKNVGLENIDEMMALRIGDRLGGGTQKAVSWRMKQFRNRIDQVLQKPFSISDLKVTGTDVMNQLSIKPGPKVGQILKSLFEEISLDSSKNEREYLLERIGDLT